jgi:hypothetical protein
MFCRYTTIGIGYLIRFAAGYMYKTSLNIGTLAGIAAFLVFLVLYYIGISPIGFGKVMGFWIPVVAVVWTNMKVRDKVLGGFMTYMQAFTIGIITIIVWCTFKGFCMYIFMTAFDQHVLVQYQHFVESFNGFMERTGQDTSTLDELSQIAKEATPWGLMISDISNNTLFGSFVCFIVSFITMRNRPSK